MKKLLIYSILALFIFSTCKKPKIVDDKYFGYGKATINGVGWTSKAAGGILNNNKDSLAISLEYWDGLILKNEISFIKVANKLAVRQVVFMRTQNIYDKLTSAYYTLRDDGDVLCDIYNVNEKDSLINNIVITSYNETTKEIRGTFDVTYIIDTVSRARCRPTSPDTIKIRNGEFYTKIF